MRTGTDRSAPGYPGGTRHPCPFCDWYLDAESLADVVSRTNGWTLMDALSQRLDEINQTVVGHLTDQHPDEYRESTRLHVDITS